MADAKPTISQSKTIGDWVKAYLDDDANEMSKRDKFRHLQRVTQFGAFCYMVQNNSKKAHIDFFDSNYTHMDTDVAKAAEMISRLIEIKYSIYPTDLVKADVESVNNIVGLFDLDPSRNPSADKIKQDYIDLANSFAEHIPQYPNPADTANMMKELNADMRDVKSDHTRLLNATGSTVALKRDDIYGIMDSATEKLAGIWKEAKDEKSDGEKALMKDQEAAVGLRVDLGIKTAKVGLLGAGAVGCIGAVVSGLFWPALGLIPIFALGKRWLPDLAKSIGGLYGNFKKRVADRYKIKKGQVKQDYIEKGPGALSKAELLLLSPGDRIILDKQRKSFPYLYGKNSIREMTMDYLNLGKLDAPTELENMVPADVRDMLKGKVEAFGPTTTYSDLMQTAQMIKSFEGKLPEMDKLPIKQKYAENAAKVIERLVFNEKIDALNSFQTTDKASLLGEDSEIRKLMATDPNLERKVRNFYAFADKEHVGMTNPNQTLEDFVRTYPTASSVNVASLTLSPGAATETHTKLAVEMVDGLTRGWGTSSSTYKNAEYTATVGGVTYTLQQIRDEISQIPNNDDKKVIEKALADQMKHLFEEDKKDYTIKAMEILRHEGTDGAKNDFVDLLKEIGELKFEDLAGGNAGELYQKILKTNPKTPAKPMDLYLLTRHRLAMQELCVKKLETLAAGNPEIKEIKDFMMIVNNSKYVDEYHKQEIMTKATNDLFNTYIKNHEYEFKTNLSKTSELLQTLAELTMLSATQRNNIIAQLTPHLEPAILSNINGLKIDFASKYDSDNYLKLLEENSTKGGLKDLFASLGTITDPRASAAVASSKTMLEYLSELGSVKRGLNVAPDMNEDMKWQKDEINFITKCFFFKADDSFIQRSSSSDWFRQFIEKDISNMRIDFKENGGVGEIVAGNIATSNSYIDIQSAITNINSHYTTSAPVDVARDGFAATLLLKNKCISLFRKCIRDYIARGVQLTGKTADVWARENFSSIETLINGWKPLMQSIDNVINNYQRDYASLGLGRYCARLTMQELTSYSSYTDALKASQSTELAR